MNINELVTAPNVAAYYEQSNVADGEVYLSEALFPNKRVGGRMLSFIKGKGGNAVLARPVAYDADVRVVSRTPFAKMTTEMPMFGESLIMDVQSQIDFNMIMSSGNDALIKTTVTEYFNDRANLLVRLKARPHQLAMSLLSTGVVKINADKDNAIEIDYTDAAWKANNKLESVSAWATLATSTALSDLESAIEKAEDDGVKIASLLMSRNTYKQLVDSKQVSDRFNAQGNLSITRDGYKTLIEQSLDVEILVENKKFKLSDGGDDEQYFPDGVVTLLPEGNIGSMAFGTTVEELSAAEDPSKYSVTADGIGISVIREGQPARIATNAFEIVLPSAEKIDSVYILDTTHTA